MKVIVALALLCFAVSAVFAKATLHLAVDQDTVVADSYLVILKKDTTEADRDAHIATVLAASPSGDVVQEEVTRRWSLTIVGYAARLNKQSVQTLLNDPLVAWIEQDQVVTADEGTETQIQVDPAAWGLRRIGQREFNFEDDEYTYWESAGENVDIYIIDTGILTSHQDFENRAILGYNAIPTETPNDCNGHGTHVASSAAGESYGVAKKSTLIAVKVLGCGGSGTWAGVIDGVEWTSKSHNTRRRSSVANMSLGGGVSAAVDAAVAGSIAQGVVYAVAAGNNGANACNYSPARVDTAITVGATTYTRSSNPAVPSTDTRSSFSNFGVCVNIFAPGQNIKAAWIGSDTATSTISGTSMASPHVAGVAAVHIGHLLAIGETVIPSDIPAFLAKVATPDIIANVGLQSPNKLLYSPIEDM